MPQSLCTFKLFNETSIFSFIVVPLLPPVLVINSNPSAFWLTANIFPAEFVKLLMGVSDNPKVEEPLPPPIPL